MRFVWLVWSSLALGQVSVTTYHYDNGRTGWNSHETLLTPANVNNRAFGAIKTVNLDDEVDAQPLIISNVKTTMGLHKGLHTVVYVATEANTIYAI
jgi:hypothetical protein